jgi:hypothetical protein
MAKALKKREANQASVAILAHKTARGIASTCENCAAVTVADGGRESTNEISPTISPENRVVIGRPPLVTFRLPSSRMKSPSTATPSRIRTSSF